MARFFFLDQSLKGPGGHHYDYALHVVRAAAEQGMDVVLGAHRRFEDSSEFPDSCGVASVFRHTVYNRFSDFSPRRQRRWLRSFEFHRDQTGATSCDNASELESQTMRTVSARWTEQLSAHSLRTLLDRKLDALRQKRFQRGRLQMARHFREDLAELFAERVHRMGDHVFLATISDVELLGLAEYVAHEPTSRLVKWHCQFHFNIFQGRPHEYAAQESALRECRVRFAEAMQLLKNQDVRFYNTSEQLADQYRRLELGEFESLAYPINPEFFVELGNTKDVYEPKRWNNEAFDKQTNAAHEQSHHPLRITLAGAVRREKGQKDLCELISAVAPTMLRNHRAQFVIQRKRRSRFRRPQLQQLDHELSKAGIAMNDTISYMDHPLDRVSYEQMLKAADVGLFLYDGRTYYARRAGVLGEFLSLGVPVIVPAGCWLSEQIREVNEEHRQHQAADGGLLTPREILLKAHVPEEDMHRAKVHCATVDGTTERERVVDADTILRLEIDLDECTPMLAIECQLNAQSGTHGFLRCEIRAYRDGTLLDKGAPNAGIIRGDTHQKASVHLPISRGANKLSVELRSAFGEPDLRLRQLQFKAIAAQNRPLGVVGLVAADREQVPRLLQEVQQHYAHYRQTATAFAKDWFATHDPKQVMRQLMREPAQRRNAA